MSTSARGKRLVVAGVKKRMDSHCSGKITCESGDARLLWKPWEALAVRKKF